jgi:hypothetical protein
MTGLDDHRLIDQPQSEVDWFLSLRMGHARLDAEASTLQRQHVLLLLDEQGDRLAYRVQTSSFSLGQVWQALAEVITDPTDGLGVRPRRLYFEQPELMSALAAHLQAAGIQAMIQAHLPGIERALVELERGFSPVVLLPPALATAPGADLELQGRIYAAATAFYQLAPWRVIPGEMPLEVRFPEDVPARWVVVMGSGGDAFGLSIYDSWIDLERMYASRDPLELAQSVSWLALTYDTSEYLAFEDLDAIRQYSWPVAHESAYPALYRVGGPQADLQAPSINDLRWLDCVLPALSQYFEERPSGDNCWHVPHESRVSAAAHCGRTQVFIRYPGLGNS